VVQAWTREMAGISRDVWDRIAMGKLYFNLSQVLQRLVNMAVTGA
jgi:hypothetical protein